MPLPLLPELLATTPAIGDHLWSVVKILLMILIALLLFIWWLRRQA